MLFSNSNLSRIWHYLKFKHITNLFKDINSSQNDPLLIWRERIFFILLSSAVLVALLSYIPNMRMSIQHNDFINASVYTFAYASAIFITFTRIIQFRIRVFCGLFLFYLIGTYSLYNLSTIGSGRIWLFTFSLIATLLLGIRAGLIALLINVLTISILSITHVNSFSEYILDGYTYSGYWSGIILSFLFLNGVTTISLGLFVNALEKYLLKEKLLTSTLKKSEQKYKTLTDNLHVGIFRIEANSDLNNLKVIEVNNSLIKLFEFNDKKDLLNHNLSSLFLDKFELRRLASKLNKKGKIRNEKIEFVTKGGNQIVCRTSATTAKENISNTTNYDGVIEDITEINQLEAKLYQAQKMEAIGTLAGGIAHDFNNLLMVIQGSASILRGSIEHSAPNLELIYTIEKQVQRGADLTKKLLGYARKGKYNPKVVDINSIIKDAVSAFSRAKKEIIVMNFLSNKPINIEADINQIEQILFNLFVNAADAMQNGGEICIKTKILPHNKIKIDGCKINEGHYALIEISDTGIGIDSHVQKKIFDPFFTTKEVGKGTGLGLASVYGIVKGHAGYIDFKSEIGKGTTFYIYFPMSKEEKTTVDEVNSYVELGKGTIMMVDDEEMVLEIGSKMLQNLGYNVIEANSGNDAISTFKKCKDQIDLVILDMIMPKMSGSELHKKLRDISPKTKFLLSSGYSLNGQAKEILKRGGIDFIQKPFTLNEISMSVKNAISAS